MLVQFALILVPIFLFIFLKKIVTSKVTRIACGLVLAVVVGFAAYYLASAHGWRPLTRGGKTVDLSPIAISLMNGIPIFLVMVVLATAKKQSDKGKKA